MQRFRSLILGLFMFAPVDADAEILLDAENLNDENYRGISWGIDAPGRGFSVRYIARF